VLRITDTPRIDDGYMNSRLALLPATGGDPSPLVDAQGKLDQPRFSPDGTHVAWLGATSANDPFAGSVYVVPVTGGAARALSLAEPGCATALEWVDSTTLLYAASRGVETALVTVPRAGGRGREALKHGPIFSGFALAPNGKFLALVGDTPSHPGEIFAAPFARTGMRLRRLTTTNPAVEHTPLGVQEVVRWTADDGLDIEGVLVRPVGFAPGTRYPRRHGPVGRRLLSQWLDVVLRWAQLWHSAVSWCHASFRGIGRGEEFGGDPATSPARNSTTS
jgi:dipeptidyl aminopeptidase/acylaminoacyl peptidase